MPGTLTAQDYVLKKKNNEVINVKCPICSSSTTVTKKRAAVKNPAEPAKKRVRTQPDPGPVEREPRTRPRAVVPISRQEPLTQLPISEVPTRPSAIVLNSHQVARVAVVPTSTPLDSAERQTFPPFNDWPDYQVEVNTVINVVITPVFTPSYSQQQLADWSSRYDKPIPVREESVELIRRAPTVIVQQPPAPVITRALVPYDSFDDDEENPNDEQYNLHVMDSALRK